MGIKVLTVDVISNWRVYKETGRDEKVYISRYEEEADSVREN